MNGVNLLHLDDAVTKSRIDFQHLFFLHQRGLIRELLQILSKVWILHKLVKYGHQVS